MPHICTRCNNAFDSGEDILKGCPNCGWKKFMFVKKGLQNDKKKAQSEQIITRAMGVREPPKARESIEAAYQEERPRYTKTPVDAPRRKDDNDRKDQNEGNKYDGKPAGKTLESIKITAPGTYELNLPSLFEREELIMAVKEGTYFIDLTSAFKKVKKD